MSPWSCRRTRRYVPWSKREPGVTAISRFVVKSALRLRTLRAVPFVRCGGHSWCSAIRPAAKAMRCGPFLL